MTKRGPKKKKKNTCKKDSPKKEVSMGFREHHLAGHPHEKDLLVHRGRACGFELTGG